MRNESHGSRSVVFAALFANATIAVLKFITYLITFSPSMLSETYHSISDTGNQLFLLVGIRSSERQKDRIHPFGYGKSQFFYSLLVSVMLFGIAGWESFKHGYEAIFQHKNLVLTGEVHFLGVTFPAIYLSYFVLISALFFESYALKKANDGIKNEMRENNWSGYIETFKKTSNITTLTAFTEDIVAIIGLFLAFIGNTLSFLTKNPFFDGIAALLIGVMLMFFAVSLALENKKLLIGESLPEEEERKIRQYILNHKSVETIKDLRTVYFGPDNILLTVDLKFKEKLSLEEINQYIKEIEENIYRRNSEIKKIYIEPEN